MLYREPVLKFYAVATKQLNFLVSFPTYVNATLYTNESYRSSRYFIEQGPPGHSVLFNENRLHPMARVYSMLSCNDWKAVSGDSSFYSNTITRLL
jgi:hypothetical protein